ncbi:hypothetical protein IJT17_04725 [bacterium]|nr:hypothetical protein [bacterium]
MSASPSAPSPETAAMPHEEELKIVLGSKPEFIRWRTALGQPERILQQLNFYLRPAQLSASASLSQENPLLLRIRTVTAGEEAETELTDALARRIISCSTNEAACAAWNEAMPPGCSIVFTLKQGIAQEGGYFRSIELEAPLTPQQAVQLLRGDLTVLEGTEPGDYLRQLQLKRCQFLGILLNTRCCYRRPQGEVWEMDLSHFPGRCDCELEVEISEPQRQRVLEDIRALAAELGTPIEFQTKTKIERFLEASGLL